MKKKKKKKAIEFTIEDETPAAASPASPRIATPPPTTPPSPIEQPTVVIPTPLPIEPFIDPQQQYYIELIEKFRQVSELDKEDEAKEFFSTILEARRGDGKGLAVPFIALAR